MWLWARTKALRSVLPKHWTTWHGKMSCPTKHINQKIFSLSREPDQKPNLLWCSWKQRMIFLPFPSGGCDDQTVLNSGKISVLPPPPPPLSFWNIGIFHLLLLHSYLAVVGVLNSGLCCHWLSIISLAGEKSRSETEGTAANMILFLDAGIPARRLGQCQPVSHCIVSVTMTKLGTMLASTRMCIQAYCRDKDGPIGNCTVQIVFPGRNLTLRVAQTLFSCLTAP